MATSLGALVLKLSADATGLLSTLDRVEKRAQNFGKGIGQAIAQPFRAAQKLASVPGDFLGGLMKPIAGLLKSIPFVGQALGGIPESGAAFVAWIRSALSDISHLSKEADRLGVSTEFLSGIALKLGGDFGAAAHGISFLQAEIARAAGGDDGAAHKFRKLGIDSGKLFRLGAEDQLRMVADGIAKLPSKAERALAVHDILPRGFGFELLPLLEQGSAGIDRFIAKAKGLGLAITPEAAKLARDAALALGEIELAVKGAGQQLAVNLAPYIKMAADWFNKMLQDAGGIEPIIGKVVDFLTEGFATVLDFVEKITKEVREMIGDAKGFTDFVRSGSKGAAHPIDFVTNALGGGQQGVRILEKKKGQAQRDVTEKSWGDNFRDVRKTVRDALAHKGEQKPGADLDPFRDAVNELNRTLGDEIKFLGLSGKALDAYKLQAKGAKGAALDFALATAQGIDRAAKIAGGTAAGGNIFEQFANKQARLMNAAQRGALGPQGLDIARNTLRGLRQELDQVKENKLAELFNSTLDPLEKFTAGINELKGIGAQGGLLGRGVVAQVQALESALGQGGETRSPAALLQGSKEAYATIVASENRREKPDLQARIANLLQVANQQRQMQAEQGRQIIEALKKNGINVVDAA